LSKPAETSVEEGMLTTIGTPGRLTAEGLTVVQETIGTTVGTAATAVTSTAAGMPTTAGTPESLKTPLAERTPTSNSSVQDVGKNRGFRHTRDSYDINNNKEASNSRDHYNSWDPRKVNGNNQVAYIRVSSNSRGSSNRATRNRRVASNFANQEASKMSSLKKIKLRIYNYEMSTFDNPKIK
jgi:hypothetical protein